MVNRTFLLFAASLTIIGCSNVESKASKPSRSPDEPQGNSDSKSDDGSNLLGLYQVVEYRENSSSCTPGETTSKYPKPEFFRLDYWKSSDGEMIASKICDSKNTCSMGSDLNFVHRGKASKPLLGMRHGSGGCEATIDEFSVDGKKLTVEKRFFSLPADKCNDRSFQADFFNRALAGDEQCTALELVIANRLE